MASREEIRLLTVLEYARKQAADGERIIAEQVQVIADMEARGLKATASQALLASFRRTQAIFMDDLNRAEAELAAFEYNKWRQPVVAPQ